MSVSHWFLVALAILAALALGAAYEDFIKGE
jgi:hypothetical protein